MGGFLSSQYIKATEDIVENIVETVTIDVAVQELEKMIESKIHPSPTHFSNLRKNIKHKEKIEYKKLVQYPESTLTHYKKLKSKRYFGFFV